MRPYYGCCSFLFCQSSVFEQGINLGLSASEVAVHCHTIVDATGSEDVFAEAGCNFLIEDVACFLKCLETVGIENLCPQVAVVSGCISSTHGV